MSAITADIIPFGEAGWLARLSGGQDDVSSGIFASALAERLRMKKGVTDAVAGIDSIAIRFDPTIINPDEALAALQQAIHRPQGKVRAEPNRIEIPVCYEGDYAPDIDRLCAEKKLSPAQLVDAHAGRDYRVAIIGFAPGFAYLGDLDDRLHTDRLATPRQRVEPGSVAIAGGFTSIYPLPSPGGWNIIGRTPLRLFNPENQHPFLFSAGDAVRFSPISPDQFREMAQDEQ